MEIREYEKIGWNSTTFVKPSVMRVMDDGIEENNKAVIAHDELLESHTETLEEHEQSIQSLTEEVGSGGVVFSDDAEPTEVQPPLNAQTLGGYSADLFAMKSQLNLSAIENSKWQKDTVGEVFNEVNSDLTEIETQLNKMHVQYGIAYTGGTTVIDVTFAEPFGATPRIFIQPIGVTPDRVILLDSGRTVNGFKIQGTASGTVSVMYFAIGQAIQ